jgi:hypothetical protein
MQMNIDQNPLRQIDLVAFGQVHSQYKHHACHEGGFWQVICGVMRRMGRKEDIQMELTFAALMAQYKNDLSATVLYATMILRDTCRGIISPEDFAAVGVEFTKITGKPMTMRGVQEIIDILSEPPQADCDCPA